MMIAAITAYTPAAQAEILANDPRLSLQDLIDYSSNMDPKTEDLFWIEVRKINPTLCPDW